MPKRLTRSGLSGYPARYREDLRRGRADSARVLVLLGGVALGLACLSLHADGVAVLAAISGAVFLYALFVVVASALSEVAIVLYFEREVPGEWFTDSDALARNCGTLDAIAGAAGVSALSTFGFADDLSGETLTWHAPEQGLLTLSRLSEKIRESPDLVREAKTILADLEKMNARLREARNQGTRFCLVLHGHAVNGQEIEMRKGRF